jgi:hypothetical protein
MMMSYGCTGRHLVEDAAVLILFIVNHACWCLAGPAIMFYLYVLVDETLSEPLAIV